MNYTFRLYNLFPSSWFLRQRVYFFSLCGLVWQRTNNEEHMPHSITAQKLLGCGGRFPLLLRALHMGSPRHTHAHVFGISLDRKQICIYVFEMAFPSRAGKIIQQTYKLTQVVMYFITSHAPSISRIVFQGLQCKTVCDRVMLLNSKCNVIFIIHLYYFSSHGS